MGSRAKPKLAPGEGLILAGGLVLLLATLGAADPGLRARLLPAKARVLAGGTVAFHFESDGVKPLGWRVVGPGSVTSAGLYAAPYSISSRTPTARVVATYAGESDVQFSAADVELVPGLFPGAQDCLGEAQSWSTTARGLDYVPVDQLPVATSSVEPEYPRWAESRGLKGSLVVNALLCRSGRVLDAWVTWPEGVERVPDLEELALAAVRKWSFTPASFQGSPRAIVVAIPFQFPPP
jgi:TonB family protein